MSDWHPDCQIDGPPKILDGMQEWSCDSRDISTPEHVAALIRHDRICEPAGCDIMFRHGPGRRRTGWRETVSVDSALLRAVDERDRHRETLRTLASLVNGTGSATSVCANIQDELREREPWLFGEEVCDG